MKGHSNPVMALTEHLDYDWVKFIIIIIIITTIIITIIITHRHYHCQCSSLVCSYYRYARLPRMVRARCGM